MILDFIQRESLSKEKLMGSIINALYLLLTENDFEKAISESISTLGQSIDCDSVTIYSISYNENFISLYDLKFAWKKNQKLINSREFNFHKWEKYLSNNNIIKGNFYDFSGEDLEVMKLNGINSIIVLPILIDSEFWGFIKIESEKFRAWNDDDESIIKTFTAALSNFIFKKNEEVKSKKHLDFLSTILDKLPIYIFIKDWNGKIRFANEHLLILLKIKKYRIIGKYEKNIFPHDFSRNHEDDDNDVRNFDKSIFREEKLIINNETLYFLYGKSCIKMNNENYILGYFIDIAERKKFEEKLKKALHELYKTNKNLESKVNHEINESRKKDLLLREQASRIAMGDIINEIIHQWKQPLNSINLISSDILMDIELNSSMESLTSKIEKIIDITDIITQALKEYMDFFNPYNDKTSINIYSVVNSIFNLFQSQLYKKNITLKNQIDKTLVIYSNKIDLQQVLLNIIQNSIQAFDYSIKKAENPEIQIYTRIINENLLGIYILDNAGGIPIEIQDEIFKPYFTTKPKDIGTGFGLYISKTLIENKLSGSISFQTINDGVEFLIQIPYTNSVKDLRI